MKSRRTISVIDRAIEVEPNSTYLWSDKGRPLHELGKYYDAIKCFDRAIVKVPDNGYAINGKGLALYELGRHDDPKQCFSKARNLKIYL